MKKLGVLLAAVAAFTTTAFGCWYKFYNYEDYIYAVNNRQIHTESVVVTDKVNKKITYTVKNNKVVDFPISVSVKLVSNDAVVLNDNEGGTVTITNSKPEIISCALQYRVLPNGNWVTVQKYETETGTIPSSYPSNFYLGRNNIYPKCKPGDVIMIRVYVTDGIWQSGNPSSFCDKYLNGTAEEKQAIGGWHLNEVTNQQIWSLKDTITFNMSDGAAGLDLGGSWAPNLVTTVIWSGKTRAVK